MTKPEIVAQKQLDAYNSRNIEAFMEIFSKEVKVFEFPNTLISDSWEKMYENYDTMFTKTPDLFCELKKRIVIGNTVIDEEYVRKNNQFLNVVAIYQITNHKISTVTFIK